MVFRPTWQGHLKLSLVTCPVALYTATSSTSDVKFNLINPETGNRIKMVTTDPDTGPLERSQLMKGYEFEKGRYVLLHEEEIKAVRLESTKTINIERFVPEAEIDRVYWDSPYYLAPDGKIGEDAFKVIREAMRDSGQIALGRIVMSTRERILALEPQGKGIVAYTIRTRGEVRNPAEIFDRISDDPPDAAMIAIAKQIISQQEGPFDTDQFNDRFEEALRAVIAEKIAGVGPLKASGKAGPDDTGVTDLMAMLRASLAGSKAARPAATPRTARGRAQAPAAKGPARRKAG